MNGGYGSWNDKEIKHAGQIDPTFENNAENFATVDEVTAAAVANAQDAHQQQQHQAQQAQAQVQQNVQHQHAQVSQQILQQLPLQLVQHANLSVLEEEAKKNRRQISNTKRAAQNRSAQKAFRLRKEKYMKELEEQAAEVQLLKQTIEELRAENLQLRDYTLALQSRVIELSPSHPPQQGDHVPAPPAAVFSGNTKMFDK